MDPFAELSKQLGELAEVFETRMLHFEQGQMASQPPSEFSSFKALTEDYEAFKKFVSGTLSALRRQLELLRLAQDRQETHSRRKVLLFHGFPEDNSEDTAQLVLSVLSDRIGLTDRVPTILESCHRLGSRQAGRNRPILVRFAYLNARNEVWNTKASLKGSNISVSEFLTRPRYEAYTAGRKHFGMARCWSMDGVVSVLCPDKSRHKTVSMTEMQALIDKFPLATIADAQKKEKMATKEKSAVKPREKRVVSKKK